MNDFKMVVTALKGLLYETHFFASREIAFSGCNISILLVPSGLALARTLCLILRQLKTHSVVTLRTHIIELGLRSLLHRNFSVYVNRKHVRAGNHDFRYSRFAG
jgi:hypothetical protein